MRAIGYGLGTLAAVGVLAGVARATHEEPRSATSYKAAVTRTPAADDPLCDFTAKSYGRVTIRRLRNLGAPDFNDMAVDARLVKLTPGCEGETLTVTATLNTTVDDCGGGSCTWSELTSFPLASCVVNPNGGCHINASSVNAFTATSFFEALKRTGVEISDLQIRRGTFVTFASSLAPRSRQFVSTALVTAYDECLAPTLVTDPPGLLLPSCTPVRSDPVCTFEPNGRGRVSTKIFRNKITGLYEDLRVDASMNNLNAACIGETLTVEVGGMAVASCVVAPSGSVATPRGICEVDRLNLPGTLIPAVPRVVVKRGTLTTFTGGVLVD